MDEIMSTLRASQHTRLPVYRGDPNNMLGLLHLRKLSRLLLKEDINKAELMQHTVEPYFVPEGTSLKPSADQLSERAAAHRYRGGRVRRRAGSGDAGGHP